MKRFGVLAALAYIILAAVSVWYGNLNQDEGWYLYAANLVREGKMLYRDFFFTQGPLLPLMYSPFAAAWRDFGLLGGRVVTAAIGLMGLLFAAGLARLAAPEERKNAASAIAFTVLGCNLYHVYYLAIPKTYALASMFAMAGFFLFFFALRRQGARRGTFLFASGLCLALAAGARVSLGVMLAVCGAWLLFSMRRNGLGVVWFSLGGLLALAAIYGPYLPLQGFREAMAYHASRGGFDPVFAVGSLSRFVRWYYPVLILLGLALCPQQPAGKRRQTVRESPDLWILPLAFLAVFAVQMAAPFPYEDYQVPVMGLLAVFAAVRVAAMPHSALLALGLAWSASFGSPLLERWTIASQDRLWPVKREKSELAQLREMAGVIEVLDPGGKELLTQDTYLAIETGRKVPRGLEMGPFSMLDDKQWKELLENAPCEIAALSGYTFAIVPPQCTERPLEKQMEYWNILKKRYNVVLREDSFGQNATPLMVLMRKKETEQ